MIIKVDIISKWAIVISEGLVKQYFLTLMLYKLHGRASSRRPVFTPS